MRHLFAQFYPAGQKVNPESGRKRIPVLIFRWAIIGTIAFFILRVLIREIPDLMKQEVSIRYSLLALSQVFLLVYYFCLGEMWRRILLALEAPLPVWRNEAIYFSAALSRYVPGKLWPLLGRFYLCKREGIGEAQISAGILLEPALNVGVALAIFLSTLPFWRSPSSFSSS